MASDHSEAYTRLEEDSARIQKLHQAEVEEKLALTLELEETHREHVKAMEASHGEALDKLRAELRAVKEELYALKPSVEVSVCASVCVCVCVCACVCRGAGDGD